MIETKSVLANLVSYSLKWIYFDYNAFERCNFNRFKHKIEYEI